MTNVHALSIPAPRPLVAEARHAAPYPVHLLGPFRAAVEAAHRETQAPIAIAAQSALAAASLAVQGPCQCEDAERPQTLVALLHHDRRQRRTEVDRGPVPRWQHRRLRRHGFRSDSARLVPHPVPDTVRRSSVGRGRLVPGGLCDEARPGTADLRHLQQPVWDSKRIRLARAKEETVLQGRRLAMHLMVQPTVAGKLLGDPMAEEIGFLPRCLIVEPESTIGTRRVASFPEAQPAAERSRERLAELLSKELPIRDPETLELVPRRLPLSAEAREALVAAADEIERAQARGGKLESVQPFASKTADNACRITGVLAMWRDPDATEVEVEDMASGLGLASYYLDEAQRLLGRSAVDADLRLADDLRIWLQNRPSKTFLTADVLQCAPRRDMRKRAVADRLLSILEEHGWVRRLSAGALVNGIPRNIAWTLC